QSLTECLHCLTSHVREVVYREYWHNVPAQHCLTCPQPAKPGAQHVLSLVIDMHQDWREQTKPVNRLRKFPQIANFSSSVVSRNTNRSRNQRKDFPRIILVFERHYSAPFPNPPTGGCSP